MNDPLLFRAYEHAAAFLAALPERPVAARAEHRDLLAALDTTLPEESEDQRLVLDALVFAADPGLVACAGPRYFGFVTGGGHPVALAADWLVSAWDQNAGLYVMSPAASVIEDVTARWLLDLLGLPTGSSVGFTTGAHTASLTALAAARHEVLRRVGWDVEADGLQGAPKIHIIVGAHAHASIFAALRMLGFGASTLVVAEADAQARMLPESLSKCLARCDGPTIVCAQAGNVNTGAFDPFDELLPLTRAHGAWLHIDGAFGLWAAAVPELRTLVRGVAGADSWSTDGHKWLNVPYDSGIVCVAYPAAHRAAMSMSAAYLLRGPAEERNGMDWVPESSRRARAVPLYATLRALGRRGVRELITRCCALAARMADRLRMASGVTILNDVVLNQVLVRFHHGDVDLTHAVIAATQREGVCWVGGTTWHGTPAMRISISGWCTREEDIDRSAESIVRALSQAAAPQIRPAAPVADAYAQLIAFLEEREVPFQLIDHPPEGRTDVVSALRGNQVGDAAKCLVLMVKQGKKVTRYVLAVIPGDARVDLAAVKALLSATYVSFAPPQLAEDLSGTQIGTVLPFTFNPALELIVDPSLQDHERIFFNAGRLDRSMILDTAKYIAVAKPRLARISSRS